MIRRLIFAVPFLWPVLGQADACHGQNLIAALSPAELAAVTAEAEVPYAHGNLWSATKGDAQITLVGTYHLNDPRFDAIVASLAPYLDKATALLVEAGPTEEAALKAAMLRDPSLMMLTTGPTLPERLSPTDWALLTKALETRGMAPFMVARLQPWLVASLLEMPACKFPLAGDTVQGLDKRMIAEAEARNLPVQALEPYDTVLSIFAQFSAADQLEMLSQTVALDASSDDMATTLADAYFAGESRLFWAYTARATRALPGMTPQKAAAEMALVDRAMISGRNASWIGVLEKAAARGRVVAAFGALHLPGDTGVLSLLAKDGWAITPLVP